MELKQITLPICSDDERQRLLKIRARRAILARVDDRDWRNAAHDGRLAVVGEFPVLQAGFPLDELALGEGVKLVEAAGELLELAFAEFGWRIARAVGRTNDGETSVLVVIAHQRLRMICFDAKTIPPRYDESGRMP